jgi:hypothetical protein
MRAAAVLTDADVGVSGGNVMQSQDLDAAPTAHSPQGHQGGGPTSPDIALAMGLINGSV